MKTALYKKIIAWGIVGLALALVYLPVLMLVFLSLTSPREGGGTTFSLSAYSEMFGNAELMSAVANTLILAVTAAALATALGTFAAIGLFNMKKRARKAAGGLNQIPVVNADIVTGVSLSLLFVFLKNIGINFPRGWATLIIAHTLITAPYVVLTVLPRLGQLNPNAYEAALDLGATPFKATVKVLVPQLIGAMTAAFALAFTLSLDDFVITRYNNGDIETLSTLIYSVIVKHGIPNSYRALSAVFFILILGVLTAINIRTRKRKRNKI